MNSRRHHSRRHCRFRQTEPQEVPTSSEPTSPNLSDPQGCLPPPHTPELPVFRNRFPSLNQPFPPNVLPPSQWQPPNQQIPFPQYAISSNQPNLPNDTPFTPLSPPKALLPLIQFGSIKGRASEERPPLVVFPPDQPSQSRIHWADGGAKYDDHSVDVSGSRTNSIKHSGTSSATLFSDFSRPTTTDEYSDWSQKKGCSDDCGQEYDNVLENSLAILAKYRPCTSCRLDTSKKLHSHNTSRRQPLCPETSSGLPQQDYISEQPPSLSKLSSGSLPREEYKKSIPQEHHKSLPQEDYKCLPREHHNSLPQEDYKVLPQEDHKSLHQEDYKGLLQEGYQSSPQEDYKGLPREHHNSLPQEDYKCLPWEHRNSLPQEDSKRLPREHRNSLPQEDYKCIPREEYKCRWSSDVAEKQFSEDSPRRSGNPPLVVRYEANQEKNQACRSLCCKSCPSCKKPSAADPKKKRNLVGRSNQCLSNKRLQKPSKSLPHSRATLHFIYIVLLAAAASLCPHTYEPVAQTTGSEETATPGAILEPIPSSRKPPTIRQDKPVVFKGMGVRLPDHWVAISVPEDEHEQEILRKYLLDRDDRHRERKKYTRRHRIPKEKVTTTTNITKEGSTFRHKSGKAHRRKVATGKSRHHHHTHKKVLHSKSNAETDALSGRNCETAEHRTEELEEEQFADFNSKNHSIEVSTEADIAIITSQEAQTRDPLWQNERFVGSLKELKNIQTTLRNSRRKDTSMHNSMDTTTPVLTHTLEFTTETDVPGIVTNKAEEDNKIIVKDEDEEYSDSESSANFQDPLLQDSPEFPDISHKFKKKARLKQPFLRDTPPLNVRDHPKEKPSLMKLPNEHILEEFPQNVLSKPKVHQKSKAQRDRGDGLRHPDAEIFTWNEPDLHNKSGKKWNKGNFSYIGKKPLQMGNRLSETAKKHDNPETSIHPGSNEMKAPPIPLAIQEPTEKPETKAKLVSGPSDTITFILRNILFFTLIGSATLFLWDLYGLMAGQTLCVIPFLLFNILWFTGVAIVFIIMSLPHWPIAMILLVLVLLHILEVLIWCLSKKKKLRRKKAHQGR